MIETSLQKWNILQVVRSLSSIILKESTLVRLEPSKAPSGAEPFNVEQPFTSDDLEEVFCY